MAEKNGKPDASAKEESQTKQTEKKEDGAGHETSERNEEAIPPNQSAASMSETSPTKTSESSKELSERSYTIQYPSKVLHEDQRRVRIIYGNVCGIENSVNIKKKLSEIDILCLTETWWECGDELRRELGSYNVQLLPSIKHYKTGRAEGGVAIALRKDKYTCFLINYAKDILAIKVMRGRFGFIIIVVHWNSHDVTKDPTAKLSDLLTDIPWSDSDYKVPIFIAGHFTATVGPLFCFKAINLDTPPKMKFKPKSKAEEADSPGEKLRKCLTENDFEILNDRFKSDSAGDCTSDTPKGCSVFDIVACPYVECGMIEKFKILNISTESDHSREFPEID